MAVCCYVRNTSWMVASLKSIPSAAMALGMLAQFQKGKAVSNIMPQHLMICDVLHSSYWQVCSLLFGVGDKAK